MAIVVGIVVFVAFRRRTVVIVVVLVAVAVVDVVVVINSRCSRNSGIKIHYELRTPTPNSQRTKAPKLTEGFHEGP